MTLEQSAIIDSNHDRSLAAGSHRQKYLIFSLCDESYGLPLSSVKEVIGLKTITAIPHVPTFFKGLINLRGMIISVIDLRLKIGFEKSGYQAKKTCVIIVETCGVTVGVIVDDVSEVANLSDEQINRDTSRYGQGEEDLIVGVAKRESEKLTLLLNVEGMLTPQDLDLIRRSVKRSMQTA